MNIFDLIPSDGTPVHLSDFAPTPGGGGAGRTERHPSAREIELEARLDRLALVTHGLWELLKNRAGYTEEELTDWVNYVDLQDGVIDGKHKPDAAPQKCRQCSRVVGRTLARCMYCGEPQIQGNAFDRVR